MLRTSEGIKVMSDDKSCVTIFAAFFFALTRGVSSGAESIDFSRDIRPILSGKCFKCHGFDANTREAELRLDVRDVAIAMEAIVPESPDESLLIERVTTTDGDDRMPPRGKPLSKQEVDKLRAWIEAGAPYEKHWAYVKPARTEIPKTASPIDHFVRKRLKKAGLEPSPPAEPALLATRTRTAINMTTCAPCGHIATGS